MKLRYVNFDEVFNKGLIPFSFGPDSNRKHWADYARDDEAAFCRRVSADDAGVVFEYTCPYCQDMHQILLSDEAAEGFSAGQVRHIVACREAHVLLSVL